MASYKKTYVEGNGETCCFELLWGLQVHICNEVKIVLNLFFKII